MLGNLTVPPGKPRPIVHPQGWKITASYCLGAAKNTRSAWAGGTFFPVVLLCQFLVLAGNRFWFYSLCTYVLRVQYSCGVVSVFWSCWEIVFGVTYVLSVQYSCAVVSVFWLWWEIVL